MTTSETPAGTQGAPGPSPRLRELGFFVGAWEAPGVFHETPFGPRKDIEMRVTGEAVDGGHWVLVRTEELPTPENPAPLSAHYLWGYDVAADEFVADWFDSNGGRAVQRSKGWEGDVFVLEGTMTMAGNSVPLRDTFTRKGPDAYHHIGEIDLGNGWIPVDEEQAVRAKG
ncbi:DUF1579 family protein [Amycolatopsis pithecellobii]|uniref:DUF1579 domain-containing protein n=1 Tax=Amycolatopsis pithecellobii TaxID=664692 RepID=A0A6N7ZCX5_9PSEU|nr:DUF1579 family protein [Amycolatopsis pithecellobii]MTD59588.1 DUF1579 domain-containing protein [Amycolatopsis pithecellobii]